MSAIPLPLPGVELLLDALLPITPQEAELLAAPADARGCLLVPRFERCAEVLQSAGLIVIERAGRAVYALATRSGEALLASRAASRLDHERAAERKGGPPCLFRDPGPSNGSPRS